MKTLMRADMKSLLQGRALGRSRARLSPGGCPLSPKSQPGLRGGQVPPSGPGALHPCSQTTLEAASPCKFPQGAVKVPDPSPRSEVPLQRPGQLGERFPLL